MTSEEFVDMVMEPAEWGQEGKPLGFGIWECWGDWIDLKPGSPSQEAAYWYAHNVLEGVRIMAKFYWWTLGPHHPKNIQIRERVRAARMLGLKVHLVIDWFNEATGPGDYHSAVIWPTSAIELVVRDMVEYFEYPEVVEVCNEPYYRKGQKNWLRVKAYTEYVNLYVKGIDKAGYKPLLVATQTGEKTGKWVTGGWEWNVAYDRCAEGKHLALHRYTDPDELSERLHPSDHPRGVAVGWRWAKWWTEVSPTGRETHINTAAGARMCAAVVAYGKKRKAPFTHLTMGGEREDFGGGSWGLHTDLIDKDGYFSMGAGVYAEAQRVDLKDYDGGATGPPPPPDPTEIDWERGIEPAANAMARAAFLVREGGGAATVRDDPWFRQCIEQWGRKWHNG